MSAFDPKQTFGNQWRLVAIVVHRKAQGDTLSTKSVC